MLLNLPNMSFLVSFHPAGGLEARPFVQIQLPAFWTDLQNFCHFRLYVIRCKNPFITSLKIALNILLSIHVFPPIKILAVPLHNLVWADPDVGPGARLYCSCMAAVLIRGTNKWENILHPCTQCERAKSFYSMNNLPEGGVATRQSHYIQHKKPAINTRYQLALTEEQVTCKDFLNVVINL